MKRSSKAFGYASVLLSAVIFGFTPVMAAISYQGGNSGVNMAFLRALLPLPLLLLLAVRSGGRPHKRQVRMGVVLGLLSFGCTLLLYSSYGFISVGLATTLHFLYPMYVVLYETFVQKKKLTWARAAGLALGVMGVFALLDDTGAGLDLRGVLLALLSGVCYAAYIVALGKESRAPLPLYQLMLIISLTGVGLCAAFGLPLHQLTFSLTGQAWVCAVLVALLTSVGASVLFQLGVRRIGKANTALYSLFEPVTSILFSVLLLGDTLTQGKLIGCALILSGLLLIALFGKEEKTVSKNA